MQVSINGARVAAAASGSLVLLGCLRNAAAVADAVLAEQTRRAGARTSIAVIASRRAHCADSSEVRFAVEDQLGAGAVIDALGALGIDHIAQRQPPSLRELPAQGVRPADLLTASGSGSGTRRARVSRGGPARCGARRRRRRPVLR